MSRKTRGFTLVELLVVMVLGAVLFVASMQIMVTNQRAYAAQANQIRGQRSIRSAVDLMYGELREISARGGDLLAMGPSSMTVRSMRGFGVVCAVTRADPPVFTVLEVADRFAAGDSVFVFADNEGSAPDDDAWIAARVTAVDSTRRCDGRKAQGLAFAGQGPRFSPPTGDRVSLGAPVREFVRYTYGLVEHDGQAWLGRTTPDGVEVPLVGPLQPATGLELAYLDGRGAVTTVSTDVRQIVVTIRTPGGPVGSVGEAAADSIRAVVYTRN
jgi:prepilin-type N-terminal cleavage/methylation domain-containing protein